MCQNLAKYEVTLHFFFNSQLTIFLESVECRTIYSICMDGRTDGRMDSHHESNTRFTLISVVHDIVHSVIYSKERSFLENLTSFVLSRNFPAMYGIRESITAVTSARHLSLS